MADPAGSNTSSTSQRHGVLGRQPPSARRRTRGGWKWRDSAGRPALGLNPDRVMSGVRGVARTERCCAHQTRSPGASGGVRAGCDHPPIPATPGTTGVSNVLAARAALNIHLFEPSLVPSLLSLPADEPSKVLYSRQIWFPVPQREGILHVLQRSKSPQTLEKKGFSAVRIFHSQIRTEALKRSNRRCKGGGESANLPELAERFFDLIESGGPPSGAMRLGNRLRFPEPFVYLPKVIFVPGTPDQ